MRSVELFSGAGGLALGLEKAGFSTVAHIEKNRDACSTLRHNRPSWNIVEDDIQEVDFREFENITLVAGGPPCQPFSMGGKAKGKGDSRDMFPEAVRAVREIRPKAFIFENVRGLLREAFSNYVEFIRLQLTFPDFPVSLNLSWEDNLRRLQKYSTSKRKGEALEYTVGITLVDAADYGVPQRRHRVFFVGIRKDVEANWFFPNPTHSYDELLRSQFVSQRYWDGHGLVKPGHVPQNLVRKVEKLQIPELLDVRQPWRTVRDAISSLGSPRHQNSFLNHTYQSGAKSYPGHTGSPLDQPSKALKAGDHGVPGGENMLRHLNGKVRYFSIRESARIQTFPDDWEFCGSWTESMRQLGNAVPVELAFAVAKSVASHMISNESGRSLQPSR